MNENHPGKSPRKRGSDERRVRLPKQPGSERRASSRYPLNLELRYSVLTRQEGGPVTGSGQTIDVSSSGLRFIADKPLEPGLKVAVYLDWPLVLDDGVQLQLIAAGPVVWSNGSEIALQIQRHEFRTRGRGLKLA